jgi:hypothetical protein
LRKSRITKYKLQRSSLLDKSYRERDECFNNLLTTLL